MARLQPDPRSRKLAAHLVGLVEERGRTPEQFFNSLIGEALDDVLAIYQRPRKLESLRKAEAATLGPVVEQRVMLALGLEEGERLDARVLGGDLDLKWSLRQRYEIRPSQIGCHCLFVGLKNNRFEVGIFRADRDRAGVQLLGALNEGNKRSFSPTSPRGGGANRGAAAAWIVRDAPLQIDHSR